VPYQSGNSVPEAAFDVVVLAASQGGRAVIDRILSLIPPDLPAPIVVSTHMYQGAASLLSAILSKRSNCRVKAIEDGEPLTPGVVHVAIPGWHTTISSRGTLRLSDGPKVRFARPSADVLLTSASIVFGARTLGAILTGGLDDGARGAEAVMQAGGIMIAQDPASCEVPSMPAAAIERNAIHLSLPPEGIARAIAALVPLPGIRNILGF
jgi:two-component system chemotaxis response regulator CheB